MKTEIIAVFQDGQTTISIQDDKTKEGGTF